MNNEWSLLLDRDGVINVRLIDAYVRNWNEFEFLPNVQDAITRFRSIFKYIFVFTNQQGVGKGLMSLQDVADIHEKMGLTLNNQIDRVYVCPHLRQDHCDCRKPNTKMLDRAKNDFPQVNYKKSIMVGDSHSDMVFGKRVGAVTVMVGATQIVEEADFFVASLAELADRLVIN